MSTPFEVLGLRAWADPDEIRSAYRSLVKTCHPDMIQDPEKKRLAQEQMVKLNLAYEEALRLASPRQHAAYHQQISEDDAVVLAEKMLSRNNPESALRQLMRSETKNAAWFYAQGRVLMAMEEYESAHQSFRRAVSLCPDNNNYRSGALDAALAMKKEKTLPGRMRRVLRDLKKR